MTPFSTFAYDTTFMVLKLEQNSYVTSISTNFKEQMTTLTYSYY